MQDCVVSKGKQETECKCKRLSITSLGGVAKAKYGKDTYKGKCKEPTMHYNHSTNLPLL